MPSALISHGLQTSGGCYSVHLTKGARLTLALESRKCNCVCLLESSTMQFNRAVLLKDSDTFRDVLASNT